MSPKENIFGIVEILDFVVVVVVVIVPTKEKSKIKAVPTVVY